MCAFRLLANRRQDVFGMKLIESLFNGSQLNQQKQILPNQVVSRYLMDFKILADGDNPVLEYVTFA